MSLFFAQTLLIASGRRKLHRTLGIGGLFLATGVFTTGVYTLFLAIPRLIALGDPPDPALIIGEQLPPFSGDLGSLMIFLLAVGGAAHYRHRPETHRQLMLLASMNLIPQANARVWTNLGLDNALEFWTPLTETTLILLIPAQTRDAPTTSEAPGPQRGAPHACSSGGWSLRSCSTASCWVSARLTPRRPGRSAG